MSKKRSNRDKIQDQSHDAQKNSEYKCSERDIIAYNAAIKELTATYLRSQELFDKSSLIFSGGFFSVGFPLIDTIFKIEESQCIILLICASVLLLVNLTSVLISFYYSAKLYKVTFAHYKRYYLEGKHNDPEPADNHIMKLNRVSLYSLVFGVIFICLFLFVNIGM